VDLPAAKAMLSLQIGMFRSSFNRALLTLQTLEVSLRQRNHVVTTTGCLLRFGSSMSLQHAVDVRLTGELDAVSGLQNINTVELDTGNIWHESKASRSPSQSRPALV
jgi:hypothetical protein